MPRPGEENGVHYYFVTKQEMERMNSSGKFIEYVSLFGNNYGTSMDSIDRVTEQGKVCILDLEFEVGALVEGSRWSMSSVANISFNSKTLTGCGCSEKVCP